VVVAGVLDMVRSQCAGTGRGRAGVQACRDACASTHSPIATASAASTSSMSSCVHAEEGACRSSDSSQRRSLCEHGTPAHQHTHPQ
jgi:hypothetical protein